MDSVVIKVEVDSERDEEEMEVPKTKRRKRKRRSSGGEGGKRQLLGPEERKRRKAARRKQRLQNLTPEQKAERSRRETERRRLKKMAEETEEEREKRERRERRKLAKADEKLRAELLEEEKKERQFKHFSKMAMMTEEEREAEKMKTYLARQAWLAKRGRWRDLPEEVKAPQKRRMKEWIQKLEGEQKERYRESVIKAQLRYFEKIKREDPERWRRMEEKKKERKRELYKVETPEQRERRRWKDKVCGVKRKLKGQLQEEGVGEEEIKRRLDEVWVRMWKEFDPGMEVAPPTRGRKRGVKNKVYQQVHGGDEGTLASQDVLEDAVEVEQSVDYCRDLKTSPPSSPATSFTHLVPRVPPKLPLEQSESSPFPGNEDNSCDYINDEGPSPPPSPTYESPEPGNWSTTSPNYFSPPTPEPSAYTTGTASTSPSTQCAECPLSFTSSKDLRAHVSLRHPEKCWKCPTCQEVVLSSQDLSDHFQTSHNSTLAQKSLQSSGSQFLRQFRFQCIRCPCFQKPSVFKTRQELFAHVKKTHPSNYWPCWNCRLLKYSKKSLEFHRKLCRRL